MFIVEMMVILVVFFPYFDTPNLDSSLCFLLPHDPIFLRLNLHLA